MSRSKLNMYPTLPRIEVNEMIGLVQSAHSVTFGGLVEIKEEADSDANILLEDIDAEIAETDQTQFIKALGVDEQLISVMMARTTIASSTNTSSSETPALPISSSIPKIPLTPAPSPLSQKRKEHPPHASTDSNEHARGVNDSDMPDSKRRRHAGHLSPSTLALSLPSAMLLDSNVLELDETPEPEPYNNVSFLILL